MQPESPIKRSGLTAYRSEYVARVNRVMDFVEQNLDRPLPLVDLARIAHFSPFHFGAMTGETLARFVQRLRIERAANLLLGDPDVAITAVAIECGFSSPATFARGFKKLTVSVLRNGGRKSVVIRIARFAN